MTDEAGFSCSGVRVGRQSGSCWWQNLRGAGRGAASAGGANSRAGTMQELGARVGGPQSRPAPRPADVADPSPHRQWRSSLQRRAAGGRETGVKRLGRASSGARSGTGNSLSARGCELPLGQALNVHKSGLAPAGLGQGAALPQTNPAAAVYISHGGHGGRGRSRGRFDATRQGWAALSDGCCSWSGSLLEIKWQAPAGGD
jgi:hypothetical protein